MCGPPQRGEWTEVSRRARTQVEQKEIIAIGLVPSVDGFRRHTSYSLFVVSSSINSLPFSPGALYSTYRQYRLDQLIRIGGGD